jgi:O-antigen ligase
MMSTLDRWLEKAPRILWAAALACLPVTSFKYFPLVGRDTMVRPLSFFPIVLLLLILFIQVLRGKTRLVWNHSFPILIVFILAALVASAAGGLYAPVNMHGADYWGRVLRAWVTLGGGLAFFISAVWMNRSEEDIHFTLRWLYVGLAITVVWCLIQLASIYLGFPDRQTMNHLQNSISIRNLTVKKRISGLSYEPSWLAGQLATVYFPWLFGSLLTGKRVTRWRWLEPVLMAALFFLLMMTYSRSGVVMAVAAAGVTFLLTGKKLLSAAWRWLTAPFTHELKHRAAALVLRLAIFAAVLAAVGGSLFILSRSDYFAKIWRSNKTNVVEYLVDIYAGPRLAYAMAGYQVFQQHPLTGAGLGSTGMYIYDNIPDWSKMTLSEISRQIALTGTLYPNAKDLFIRLLAETGIAGFGAFLVFLLSILGNIIKVLSRDRPYNRFLGITGLYLWLVLIVYNFTQDSFFEPNMWIGFGIFLGAAAYLTGRAGDQKIEVALKSQQNMEEEQTL